MAEVLIKTIQNVAIEYDTATIGKRITAFVLDQIIIWSTVLLTLWVFFAMFPKGNEVYFILLVATPIYLFYTLATETLNNGQTFGKKLLGIRVIKSDGSIPGIGSYVLRWVFRSIDITLSAGIVAVVSISSSRLNQRIGGYLSETMVVNISSKQAFKVKDLESIDRDKEIDEQYSAITQFSESEMLLFKETIERDEHFSNMGSREAVHSAANTIKSVVNISESNDSDREVIQKAINNYVLLTR